VRWSCPERLACRDGQRCRAPGAVAERRSDGSEPGASDDASKEDVVALAPSESVDIYRNFRTFTGPYVTYCHNLAHEDHAMMFGWAGEQMLLEDLPLPVQRTILRRDAEVRPLLDAVSEIDLSWTIVQGNAKELLETTAMWSGSHAQSRGLWTDQGAKFHYHRLVIRRLHNFLSAATAQIAHLTRQSRNFRKFDSALYTEFVGRKEALDRQLALLIEVRDYSEHAGPHHSVLILQGTTGGGLVGFVGLQLTAFVEDLKHKATRAARAKLALALITEPKADPIDISTLVNEYYAGMTAHRQWFRERLLALYSTLSNDLPRWALSDADRQAVIEWRDANPIPVHRGSETVAAERQT